MGAQQAGGDAAGVAAAIQRPARPALDQPPLPQGLERRPLQPMTFGQPLQQALNPNAPASYPVSPIGQQQRQVGTSVADFFAGNGGIGELQQRVNAAMMPRQTTLAELFQRRAY